MKESIILENVKWFTGGMAKKVRNEKFNSFHAKATTKLGENCQRKECWDTNES